MNGKTVKKRYPKFKCTKKVSKKEKYAIMENDLEIIVKLHAESTRIARDSIEAVHAYEKWVHALPIELKKQLRAHPSPEIVWETKKS